MAQVAARGAPSAAAAPPVARVLPDVAGFERELDYEVPAKFAAEVRPGSIVRVPLQGRAVRGWVVAYPVQPPEGLALRPIAKVTGWGPSPSCSNWPNGPPGVGQAGAARCFSPPRRNLPSGRSRRRPGAVRRFSTGLGGPAPGAPEARAAGTVQALVEEAWSPGAHLLRLPPSTAPQRW